MFEKLGGLQQFWYVIANSSEVKKNSSIVRTIHGVPLLIWRDQKNNISCVLNVCPHKKSPLMVEDFSKNELRCPYHGWKFDAHGNLIEIPSAQHLITKVSCKIEQFELKELNGFIYFCPKYRDNGILPLDITKELSKKWGTYSTQKIFHTTEELLIENFMDASHTPTIHNKLIRSESEKTKHHITVKQQGAIISASYKETIEKIAFGLRLIFGKNYLVSHTDTFLLPNIVKVDYFINGTHRFNALIACTEQIEGKTYAFIRISFQFGLLNSLILSVIPYFVRKVIQQDFDITKKQYENMVICKDLKMHPIEYDVIFNKVNSVRNKIQKGIDITHVENTQEIEITI